MVFWWEFPKKSGRVAFFSKIENFYWLNQQISGVSFELAGNFSDLRLNGAGSAAIRQNGRETDFPVFPDFPVPETGESNSVHPGVILGSARTQRYPTWGPWVKGVRNRTPH